MKITLFVLLVVVAIGYIEAVCQDDPTADCANNKNLCNIWQYDWVMNQKCPKTCNRCGTPMCADKDTRCATWEKNQKFCENNQITPAEKKEACKKTCGFC